MIAHLAKCDVCRNAVLDAMDAPGDVHTHTPHPLPIAVLAVVVAATAFVLHTRQPQVLNSLSAAMAQSTFRSVEPRLRGGFGHKPFRPSVRGLTVPGGLDRVDAYLLSDPHSKGVVELLEGHPDAAITLMETVLRGADGSVDLERTTRADVLTDYAAALYERARRDQRPLDLATAFTAASRAIELEPRAPEGWHAYALVLQALRLDDHAIDAWQSYLRLDPSSGWAIEARQHVADLQARAGDVPKERLLADLFSKGATTVADAVALDPRQARVLVEEQLLGDWGRAVREGRAEEARLQLERARQIAETLATQGRDQTPRECVQRIAAANESDLPMLAQAHEAYQAARTAMLAARDAHARDMLFHAASLLDQAKSPLASRALIYAATVAHYLGGNDRALEVLSLVAGRLSGTERAHPLASGQVLWTRGLTLRAMGFPHESLVDYRAALEHIERTGEFSSIAGIEGVIAENLRFLGDPDGGWIHHLRALQFIDIRTEYPRRQSLTASVCIAARDTGNLRLAELIARRIMKSAVEAKDPVYEAFSLLALGRIAVQRRRFPEALSLMERAAALVEGKSPSSTMRLEADVAVARGELLASEDPDVALGFLQKAQTRFETLNERNRLPNLHLFRARALQKRGDRSSAEAAARRGLDELEERRKYLTTDEERSRFTDTGRALYDFLIAHLVAADRSADALSIVRRARTIGLTTPVNTNVEVSGNGKHTGDAAVLLEYYVLPDSLLTWLTIRGDLQFHAVEIRRAELTRTIEGAVDAIAHASSTVECLPLASRLYELLIGPVATPLASEMSVVIAPDSVLHAVPFAALYDKRLRQFLVERHSLAISLGSRRTSPRRLYQSALVVASAAPGDDLPPLPRVEEESRRVAQSFPQALLLEGSYATGERLIAEARHYDVLHYAGHAVWNERQPRYAALRLRPDPRRPGGTLYAHEIQADAFANTHLVVLAACDTARGRAAGVGLLSFARTFVAAGVPDVIGSLWPAEDEASAELFADFYAELHRGAAPADALRTAQRSLLRSSFHASPRAWATFQLYTSGS